MPYFSNKNDKDRVVYSLNIALSKSMILWYKGYIVCVKGTVFRRGSCTDIGSLLKGKTTI